MWSNADEVDEFIREHKGRRWLEGDRLVLPDIEQAYTVVGVRPFRTGKRFYLYVDLESVCALEDCEEPFIVSKEVHEWMASPHLTRCCSAHRRGYKTEMPLAWKTAAQRAEIERKAEAREARALAKAARKAEPRIGGVEQAVLRAVDELGVVSEVAGVGEVVAHACTGMEAPAGRDTRRQRATRALRNLIGRGLLREQRNGLVFLGRQA